MAEYRKTGISQAKKRNHGGIRGHHGDSPYPKQSARNPPYPGREPSPLPWARAECTYPGREPSVLTLGESRVYLPRARAEHIRDAQQNGSKRGLLKILVKWPEMGVVENPCKMGQKGTFSESLQNGSKRGYV